MVSTEQPVIDLSILSRLEAAVGGKFLAYMLSCSVDSIYAMIAGTVSPNQKQTAAISQLAPVIQTVPAELDTARINEAIRSWLTVAKDGKSIVNRVREHVSGPEATIETEGGLERAIATLALDAYPAFLLTPDERLPAMRYSTTISALAAYHPEKAKFCDGVLLDSVLRRIFTEKGRHTGYSGVLYSNTGVGGGLQLSVLPEVLLQAAWRNLEGADVSPQEFAARAVAELDFARAVVSGETRTVAARVAFAGVLLPDDARLELPNGDVVRPIAEADRQLAAVPEDMKGRASSTDSSGNSTTINYEGDVVLVHRFPYEVRIGNPDDDRRTRFDPAPHTALQRVVMRLRFSLMLAVERERRVQIVEAWRCFDQPLSQGWSVGLGDPRRTARLHPSRLTETEVAAWGEWYKLLNTPYVDRIDVALTRVLQAAAGRREPPDLLIDSVIAWENLFGSPEGEPTLRVTTCLALLLEESFKGRQACKKRLGAIYRLRNKVVHGNDSLRRTEYPMCQEALDVAIQAIRVLVSERTDILELSDGNLRSNSLLLGA